MRATWGRRARGPLSAVLALTLVPLLSASGPLAHLAATAGAKPLFSAEPSEGHFAYRSGARPVALQQGSRLSRSADGMEGASGSAKGRLWSVSALADHGLPVAAKRAYRRAAARMATEDPGCRLPCTLLAGIGRVESDHGRYGGARLGADGLSRPRIIGVQLDGKGPVAAIRDTDGGRLDRDTVWDRAVGPMQFIPSTWRLAARDGDGDGRMDPHDLDDAAAAAASYLCSGSGSLLDPGTQAAAIHRYNQDRYYVALVQAFEVGYRTGVFVLPLPPPTEEELAERSRLRSARLTALREDRRARRPMLGAARTRQQQVKVGASDSAWDPSAQPSSSSTASPQPSPKPSPTPSPTPAPAEAAEPQPYEKKGKLTGCDGGYCLGGEPLDLGAVAAFDKAAAGDYDLDGAGETNGDEVDGLLLMAEVTMVVVQMDSGRLGIYSINGKPVSE